MGFCDVACVERLDACDYSCDSAGQRHLSMDELDCQGSRARQRTQMTNVGTIRDLDNMKIRYA